MEIIISIIIIKQIRIAILFAFSTNICPRFTFVKIISTSRTLMVFLKPWKYAFYMEMVSTRKEKHFFIFFIFIAANCTRLIYTCLCSRSNRKLRHIFMLDSIHCFYGFIILFVYNGLKSLYIHPIYWTFSFGNIVLSVCNFIKFILIINPI